MFQPYEDRLEFTYLTGLPLDDLLNQVARLPDRSIVYYLHVFQDGTGKMLIPADVAELVSARANAPVYGHVGTYVGRGLVGGQVFSFETSGKAAAALGLRILAGERPEDIGVQKPVENSDAFDWRQLRRWGISVDHLPPNSEVLFKEPDFWDLYHWHIIGIFSVCIIEALLIAALLVQTANLRRAEERFRQVVEAAPTGMLLVSRAGRIVLANAQMEALFGYSREELLGQFVEFLMPERFRAQHPEFRAAFSPRLKSDRWGWAGTCSVGARMGASSRWKSASVRSGPTGGLKSWRR